MPSLFVKVWYRIGKVVKVIRLQTEPNEIIAGTLVKRVPGKFIHFKFEE